MSDGDFARLVSAVAQRLAGATFAPGPEPAAQEESCKLASTSPATTVQEMGPKVELPIEKIEI